MKMAQKIQHGSEGFIFENIKCESTKILIIIIIIILMILISLFYIATISIMVNTALHDMNRDQIQIGITRTSKIPPLL